MLVNESNFHLIKLGPVCSVDTETTGLDSFKDGRLFSIVVADDNDTYYFNFQDYPLEGLTSLSRDFLFKLNELLNSEERTYFLQNAKFDMHMLWREGIELKGTIYDLQFLDRLHNNQHLSYSLAEISKRWGTYKDDAVLTFVKANKLITKGTCPESGKDIEAYHYDKVPFSLMLPYAEQDARATYDIGLKLMAALSDKDKGVINRPILKNVIENESKLVKVLFKMEQNGIKIDKNYCISAMNFYRNKIAEKSQQFLLMTGHELVKGTTVFEEVFKSEMDKWVTTPKGNWKWDSDVIESFTNPAGKIVQEYAESKKQLEYFENFTYYKDYNDVIHPNFKQAGTATGRLSCTAPNLQNLTNSDKYEEETEASLYPVRKAFIPRDGYMFVMIDFAQSEYRLFLEYAKAYNVIQEVLGGKDVHQANADIASVTRKQAKTIGFGLLYGQGVGKLTYSLFDTKGSEPQVSAIYKHMIDFGITERDKMLYRECPSEVIAHDTPLIRKAMDIKKIILKTNPEYDSLIKRVSRTASERGYIFNCYGRQLQFPNKSFSYRAINHLIQSSCADMIKAAMIGLDAYLEGKQSRMLLQIHDEIVFEVRSGEEHIIPELKAIMERAYSYTKLPQIAEVSWSKQDLSQKKAWSPSQDTPSI